MGVFLRRTASGFSPYWFGRWEEDGKRHETSLKRWRGVPPAPGEKRGDPDFEKSRGEAEALFKRIREGERSREEEAALVRKIHAARYGMKVDRVKIEDLAEKWDALPHKADLSEGWRALVHTVLGRFAAFMGDRFPNVNDAGALTAEHFKAFFAHVDEMGLSGRAWNYHLTILRGTLAKVDGQGAGFRDYLARLPKRAENAVHRRPFTGEELEAIFAAARAEDPGLYPVIVAAACTALRRGDVARLRWDAVDMDGGFVTVKTSKTGETVEIPIFPPFMLVLQEAAAKRKQGVPYVFPAVALAYQRNADGLNVRLRRVLAAAGFVRPDRAEEGRFEAPEDEETAAELLEDGMRRAGWTAKRRDKARQILALHYQGKNGKQIAAEIATSKGAVSDYFKAMEEAGKMALVSPPKREAPTRPTLAERKDGEQRKHRGSLCGWHSFRTTFCTLALANGVPMEILRKITGHRTAEIVLKHYDRRGREETRKAFGAAMPKAIAGAVAAADQRNADGEELIAVPPEVARLGKMLADASPELLEKVAEMLAAEGGKAKTARRKGGRK